MGILCEIVIGWIAYLQSHSIDAVLGQLHCLVFPLALTKTHIALHHCWLWCRMSINAMQLIGKDLFIFYLSRLAFIPTSCVMVESTMGRLWQLIDCKLKNSIDAPNLFTGLQVGSENCPLDSPFIKLEWLGIFLALESIVAPWNI